MPDSGFALDCPIPFNDYDRVLLAHGGGGTLTQQLIEKIFLPAFGNAPLLKRHDASVMDLPGTRVAMTTDSYVVKPIFFPGGDIGKLAVTGTVNDLAMAGAKPLYLTAGFILEEGFPLDQLWKIVQSMRRSADEAGVFIVTGDTKVVDKGKGDGVFINTSGLGVVEGKVDISPASVKAGDAVILSGDLGRHGIAIMAAREGLEFETTLESDCAFLHEPVLALLKAGVDIHCLRDLTRGGLASAVNEIAQAGQHPILLDESRIPVTKAVNAACELLGLDPLYVANEGRFALFLPEKGVPQALEILAQHPVSSQARVIGHVLEGAGKSVRLKSVTGATRILDLLSGEQLPRIC
jgi:hydrogenase expression/formation protein HypE